MVISVPPICNKAFFTQGLNVSNWINLSVQSRWHHGRQEIYLLFHFLFLISFIRQLANTAAQLTTLSTMNFILKRADKNIEYLMEKSERHSSQGYTADLIGELMQQYRETLSKVSSVYSEKQTVIKFHQTSQICSLLASFQILPDLTSIIAKWQSISKKEKAAGEEKQSKAEETVTQTNEENETPGTSKTDTFIVYSYHFFSNNTWQMKAVGWLFLCVLNSCWNSWGNPAEGSDSSGHLSLPESRAAPGEPVQVWL